MTRPRVFAIALVVATLFHLSMVSVFSIVTRFPARSVPYASLEIVRLPMRTASAAQRDLLRVPSPDQLIEAAQAGPADVLNEIEPWESAPAVELPRLEIARADPLQTRENSLKIRRQFSDLFERRPKEVPDSWALFTRELRGIGPTLSRLTFRAPLEKLPERERVSSPVPGLAVYVEWLAEPKHRKVLFAPPIPALWNLDPAQVDANGPEGPIAVTFTVNPQGKVIDVQTPVEDAGGVITDIKTSLLKYVFEPMGMEDTRDQRGTLLITTDQSGP